MNLLRLICCLCGAAWLAAPAFVSAQTTAPSSATPPVVLHSTAVSAVASPELSGVPPAVANLVINFNAQRDKFLLKQHLLLEQLANATTKEQREAIRAQLQDNRQAFLDELSDFRVQLKNELRTVQGRVSNAEFLRIIEAAQGSSGDHHHRGH